MHHRLQEGMKGKRCSVCKARNRCFDTGSVWPALSESEKDIHKMTVEEMLSGESKNIEFKEMLPKRAEKYLKTIVAYANTQGVKLLFGMADGTREITGFDEEIDNGA